MDIDLRKLAADIFGPSAFQCKERHGGAEQLAGVDRILIEKIAGADPELLRVAATINPENITEVYERLGGSYTAPREGVSR
jgi:hypothetical protein